MRRILSLVIPSLSVQLILFKWISTQKQSNSDIGYVITEPETIGVNLYNETQSVGISPKEEKCPLHL